MNYRDIIIIVLLAAVVASFVSSTEIPACGVGTVEALFTACNQGK